MEWPQWGNCGWLTQVVEMMKNKLEENQEVKLKHEAAKGAKENPSMAEVIGVAW